MVAQIVRELEAEQFKPEVPEFGPGDTVRVHAKVVEGNRERIQVFEGVVIRRRAGGINENFTVRRIASHGIGVERTFLVHSPRIDKIEVTRRGRVRRAKLYYLRGLHWTRRSHQGEADVGLRSSPKIKRPANRPGAFAFSGRLGLRLLRGTVSARRLTADR